MPSTSFENLNYEVRTTTAWITIDRPEKLNALNRSTVEEIVAAEMASLSPAEAQDFSRFLQQSLDRIERSPKPVIAAVNGFALGGGCELALACHMRIAADRARFGQPEVNLGLIPGAGGTLRLQRVIGRGRALEMILTGEMIDSDQAVHFGLVSRVVPAEQLGAAVSAYAANLAKKSPMALGRALEAVIAGGEIAQPEAARLEASLFGLCFGTEDMREGTRAFLDKRKPVFPGR